MASDISTVTIDELNTASDDEVHALFLAAGFGEYQEIMKVPEITAIFGIHERTLTRWVREGRFPVIRTIGGHTRFTRAGVERVLLRGLIQGREEQERGRQG